MGKAVSNALEYEITGALAGIKPKQHKRALNKLAKQERDINNKSTPSILAHLYKKHEMPIVYALSVAGWTLSFWLWLVG